MRGALLALVCLASVWAVGSVVTAAQSATAEISGTVVDAAGHVLPGAAVALEAVGSGAPRPDAPDVPAVNVVASTGAGEPIETDEFRPEFLRVFQLPTDRFQEALPLLPGVVRDPRGRLSFNGTRPSQSTLLVNGTNATDPVTGQFAFDIPLSAIDTVEIQAIPYSAEYGRVSGAVTEVRTRAGDDHWDFSVGSLFPNPRFRGSTVMGINTATPRVQVSGPLRRGTAWVSQAFSYRFVRSQVKADIPGEDEELVEGFDIFTQIDLKLSERHSVTATVSAFPTEVDNMGIDSLHLAAASPEVVIGGWNLAVVDDLATGANTLWQTRVAFRGFDLAVRPEGAGAAQLTPEGLRGNYFNMIDRQSQQLELGVARLQSWRLGTQEHLVKVGGQLFATSFDGIDRSGPIEVRGADGGLLKRITFRGAGALEASDVMSSAYVQDHWQVTGRLALDLGLRYDSSSMLAESHLSPRLAFSLALDATGQTLLKGGWGFFFDQTFLQVDAFERFQQRVEQDYQGNADTPTGPPLVFENRVDPEGLEEPTSKAWNIEIDRQLGRSLLLRLNYRENRARGRLLVNRVTDAAGPALVLSSTGRLTGREFDATLRWALGDRGDLFVSFSKIRAKGDANDFGLIYDNHREPLVLDNANVHAPFEVPNRLLLWGVIALPKGLTLTPGAEWRSGFPYTVFAGDFSVVGERNDWQFPRFLSVDMGVTKHMDLFGRSADVGLQFYNLTSHDNPRDVVSNLASPAFGVLRNSVGSTVSLKLGVGL